MSFRSSPQPEAYIQKTSRINFSGKKSNHRDYDDRDSSSTKMKPYTKREKYQNWKYAIEDDDEEDDFGLVESN